jgi:hypothetical protein
LSNVQQWQSVADRINELEKQQQKIHDHNKQQQSQQQQYTFLDPSKTNRIPNSTLKAFQKNAIQSYFERQQLQQQSLRISNHSRNGKGNKSDELAKLKQQIVEAKAANAQRPQSLNLNGAMPGNVSPASANTASQRSSLSSWPSNSPILNSPLIANNNNTSNNTKNDVVMKNANEVVKMNMKNSAISSVMSEIQHQHQQQQQHHGNRGNSKSPSINSKLYTSFCEIKTENNYASRNGLSSISSTDLVDTGKIEDSLPPPLPRKSCILRRLVLFL